MRLCVVLPCFFRGVDLCEAIRTVAALGYDAVETYRWKELDLDLVRETLDACGVEMMSICTTEFRLNDPAHRAEWLDGLRQSCEAAKRLGVKRQIGRAHV